MAKPTYRGLTIRKLADKSVGVRMERDLHASAGEPWPLAGVRLEGDPVKHARIPTSTVTNGRAEGWITLEGEQVVFRTGGPPDDPWRVTHTFQHAETIVFHTVDGDVRYRVVENPDKWPAEKQAGEHEPGFGGEVRWYYDCELEA